MNMKLLSMCEAQKSPGPGVAAPSRVWDRVPSLYDKIGLCPRPA